jgi:hypothetical protein
VLQPDGTRTEEEVVDYAVQMWRDLKGDADLPDHFVTAQDLAPLDHVRMQAAAQPWVDSSISKTINVPADIGFEAFKDVYLEAYETGCKGCTTYRPNEVTGSVLSVGRPATSRRCALPAPSSFQNTPGEAPQAAGAEPPATRATDSDVIYMSEPLDRPGSLEGHTYKLKWPDSDHALYITINDIMLHGHRRPFEIFINSKNMEHFAWTVALTRMISAVFRRGRRRVLRGGGAQGRLRPARRGLDEREIRALDPRGHRRRDRAAPDLHRLHRRRGDGAQDRPAGGGREPRAPRRSGLPLLRAIRHAHDRRLPDLRQLRTFEVRISHTAKGIGREASDFRTVLPA